MERETMETTGAVFVQTNELRNRVLAFERDSLGALGVPTAYETGGAGTGVAHLPSQGSAVLSEDRRFLLVANAGSDDVAVFGVQGARLTPIGTTPAGGEAPRSITERGGRVYVLNTGKPGIAAFALSDAGLEPLVNGESMLSFADADPAQVGFTPDGSMLIVTERGTDAIESFRVRGDGSLFEPATIASPGPTPYGFAFTSDDTLVVTEAFRAGKGAAAVSSYSIGGGSPSPVTRSIGNGMSEICWAVVGGDGRSVFTTNFAESTVSRFIVGTDRAVTLADAAAGEIGERRPGLRDEDVTDDGRFLYAIDADGGAVVGWRIEDDSLTPSSRRADLPTTIAGLAAI
jgi:6-phosphogluconolactonase (cycloisomerase 2 family)